MNLDFFERLTLDSVDDFLDYIPDDILTVQSPIFPYTNALNFAAYHNCVNAVRFFQENIPELFHLRTRLSPAHYAAMNNSAEALGLLNRDAYTAENLSPLMLAAYYNQIDAAAVALFDNVGKTLKSDCMGMKADSTALLFALRCRSKDVATLLLPYEAFLNKEVVQDEMAELFAECFQRPGEVLGCFVKFDIFVQQSYNFLVSRDEISPPDEQYRTPSREAQQARDLEISAGVLREENGIERQAYDDKNREIAELQTQLQAAQQRVEELSKKTEQKIVIARPANWKQRKLRQRRKNQP